ncbi:helicase-associated domain-containing protein [uncultured Thermanaerothrix sp.]|uniref:helicase-associated domain-containing protein n=1 Tax=uncultured Thermanaerothrix sp. TaxID=1195149 RepID=UPI002636F4B2|nr:helicase-associated domain-containing protein [uncultured Thermanaerothrix sp.]
MPDLLQTLKDRDLDFLHRVAGLWGIDLGEQDERRALQHLIVALQDQALFWEMVESLPATARQALDDLAQRGGRLPWAIFSRRYGDIRPIGAARRERERPDLHPVSPAEMLWYRALIGRAFLDLPPVEPQEYAYIPDEWLAWLQTTPTPAPALSVRPATPTEAAHPRPANDAILDHVCTALAAWRSGRPLPELLGEIPTPVLQTLLQSAGLLDEHGQPLPESVQRFLQAPRGEALCFLFQAWRESRTFNELRLLPHLAFEGQWENNPLQARVALLSLLSPLATQPIWWSLEGFIAAVRENHPDFQRPAGDYDSWFIRRAGSEQFLRGFAHWEEVDGALVRFILTGPLHWLGVLDLAAAAPEATAPITAFRFSAWASALLAGEPPQGLAEENGQIMVQGDATLTLPPLTPRWLRYQIARFGEWLPADAQGYHYRLTPASLLRARQQGLKITYLLALLQKHATMPPPPMLIRALQRWESQGTSVRIERVILLRVNRPEVLTELQRGPAARYLAEVLSPTLALVRPGQVERLRRALAEQGYLAEVKLEG